MPTTLEYAQLSARVYNRTPANRVPLLQGWNEVLWLPDNFAGFSSGVYQRNNEIVISFTGTNEGQAIDFAVANLPLAVGIRSPQLASAVSLYREIRESFPGASISLTGHSLGGGLASLIGVYFNRSALVFDPAPFGNSALSRVSLAQVQEVVGGLGVDPDFDAYQRAAQNGALFSEYQRRVQAIGGRYLKNEILQALRVSAPAAVGPLFPIDTGSTNLGAIDLHSIVLLSSFLSSTSFESASRLIPDLLPIVFDKRLFATDPQASGTLNLLDHLYQHQVGTPGVVPDAMLDRFGVDFLKIRTIGGDVRDPDAFVRSAMEIGLQHYYQQDTTQAAFFESLPGGIQVNLTQPLGDIQTALADIKGYAALKEAARDRVRAATELQDRELSEFDAFAGEKRRWSINLGSNGMTGAATGDVSDLVLGGAASDSFDAGAGEDLLLGLKGNDRLSGEAGADKLYGGTGKDVLEGGADNDLLDGGDGVGDFLVGGKGFDEYRIKSKHGDDVIFDEAEGGVQRGKVVFDDVTLTGGKGKGKSKPGNPLTTWYDNPDDPKWQYDARAHQTTGNQDVNAGPVELIVRNVRTGSATFIEEFRNGDLGINLGDGTDPPKNPGNPGSSGLPPPPPKPGTPPKSVPRRWRGDPLFVDLTGDGLGANSTTGLAANIHVDLDGDGFAEKAGWVNQNAGVLILDKDANGAFTDGQELFGDFTRLAGGQLAANGFQALSQFDRNRDGVIDATDEVWSSLKIGRYESNPFSGEALIGDPDVAMSLVSLSELGITSINLANTLIANPAAQADGNIKVRSGSLSFADGSTREVAEYRLVRDESDTRFTQWREETPEIAALPELKLGGRVMDLHQALIRDAESAGYKGKAQGTLRAALDAYLNADSPATLGGSGSPGNANPAARFGSATLANRQTAFENLINIWIGVDAIPANARSGGLSLRQATILEQVYGPGYQNADWEQSIVWDIAYRRLTEGIYGSLAAQTHLKDDYALIDWRVNQSLNAGAGEEIGHMEAVPAAFRQKLMGEDTHSRVRLCWRLCHRQTMRARRLRCQRFNHLPIAIWICKAASRSLTPQRRLLCQP